MYRDTPDYIQFYPTLRCNLSCSFCFNRGVVSRPDVTVRDFGRIVSLLAKSGVKGLDILGGEPTLHPRFSDLVQIAYAAEMSTTVSTNGFGNVRLLEDVHRRCGNEKTKIGISVNTGGIPGELYGYIAAHRPLLKSVCTRDWKIPDAVREYLSLPGAEWYLIFMDAVSRKDLERCLAFYEYLDQLNRLRTSDPGLRGVYCSGFLPDTGTCDARDRVRCPAGTTKLSLLPDGSAYPCYLLFRNEDFRLGNILTDGFEEIWKSPRLDFFRRFGKNACVHRRCDLFSRCHGGCPAVSLLICGDLRAPDPRCVRPS